LGPWCRAECFPCDMSPSPAARLPALGISRWGWAEGSSHTLVSRTRWSALALPRRAGAHLEAISTEAWAPALRRVTACRTASGARDRRNQNRRAPCGARRFGDAFVVRSAIPQTVGGALPLRDVVGNHAGRLHRGLAELGIAGDLALDALAFGVQQVAQALELRD